MPLPGGKLQANVRPVNDSDGPPLVLLCDGGACGGCGGVGWGGPGAFGASADGVWGVLGCVCVKLIDIKNI